MKIIIVGIGKVGYAIAEQMTGENHDHGEIGHQRSDEVGAGIPDPVGHLDQPCGRTRWSPR